MYVFIRMSYMFYESLMMSIKRHTKIILKYTKASYIKRTLVLFFSNKMRRTWITASVSHGDENDMSSVRSGVMIDTQSAGSRFFCSCIVCVLIPWQTSTTDVNLIFLESGESSGSQSPSDVLLSPLLCWLLRLSVLLRLENNFENSREKRGFPQVNVSSETS